MENIQDILDTLSKQIDKTEKELLDAIYEVKNSEPNEFLDNKVASLKYQFDMLMAHQALIMGVDYTQYE